MTSSVIPTVKGLDFVKMKSIKILCPFRVIFQYELHKSNFEQKIKIIPLRKLADIFV